MAVPRLREAECFLRLDPAEIEDTDRATTIRGASELGVPVEPDGVEPIDLIVAGSVAVTERGERVGKGEGYSDLEFAILGEFGLVDCDTPTATTVHELQVVDEAVPTTDLDVPIDLVCTPERTVRTGGSNGKPTRIDWSALSDERLDEIPILRRLRTEFEP